MDDTLRFRIRRRVEMWRWLFVALGTIPPAWWAALRGDHFEVCWQRAKFEAATMSLIAVSQARESDVARP